VIVRENPQYHFIHHKSHMTWRGIEWEPSWWEAEDWPREVRHAALICLVDCFDGI
jgi:hypothetical protein